MLCFIGLCQKKTDVSSKSNRLLRKHVVLDMVCETRRKKWIKRFSKSEMKREMLFISAVFCSVNFSVPNLNKVV